MATLTLPQRALPVIILAVAALLAAFYRVVGNAEANLLLAVAAFFMSGFLADAFTGIAHFAFDYVFPHDMPIVGPIAREFNEHHDEPTLDPSAYVENFTKGAYASVPVSLLVIGLSFSWTDSTVSFFIEATLLAMAVWALFFHEIHAFAHMGSAIPAEIFTARVNEINRMDSTAEKKLALRQLFETVPIPTPIRLLQRIGLLLNPEKHNLHHLEFESNFSSVNGWSDRFLNPILGPIARRYKARETSVTGTPAPENH